MENNEFKEVFIEIRSCYYFDDMIKLEDFDFDNILINVKSRKMFLIYDVLYKNLISPKNLRIRFDKIDRFIKTDDRARSLALLFPKI